jgi:hypothetical protein
MRVTPKKEFFFLRKENTRPNGIKGRWEPQIPPRITNFV